MQHEIPQRAVKTGQHSHVSRTKQRIVQQDRCAAPFQKLRRRETVAARSRKAAAGISMASTIA